MTFSIVIPLYNKVAYIGRAIESVLGQTVEDFELIVVDDGSTDTSADVVSSFQDDRVRLIQQENRGVASARNKGIASARCDFICLLDADDVWEPWFLEEIKELISADLNALLFSTAFKVKERDGHHLSYLQNGLANALDRNGRLDYLACLAQSKFPISSSSVCIHRRAFESVGCFDASLKIGEDIDMWSRICSAGTAMHSTRFSAIYHRDAENRSVDQDSLHHKHLDFIEKLILNLRLFQDGSREKLNISRFIAAKAYETVTGSNRRETAERAFELMRPFKSNLPLRSRIGLFRNRLFQ